MRQPVRGNERDPAFAVSRFVAFATELREYESVVGRWL